MTDDLLRAWPERQIAYRNMQRKVEKQKFLQGPLGQITAIDDFFTKLEEGFVAERAQVGDPRLYDEVLLDICRWYEVTSLLLRTNNSNVKHYIRRRAKQPLKLPMLPKTNWDLLIDEELEGRNAATAN